MSTDPTTPPAPRHGRPRKPPWWPDDEPWPPSEFRGYRGGPWGRGPSGRRHGPPLILRFGCALIVLALLVGFTLTVAFSVIAAVLGGTGPAPWGGGILLVAVVVTVVVAVGAIRAVGRVSAPLEELADAAEKIERGDYSTRVVESGPRRMRALARAFNDMSARLATVDAGRRAFLADAAHELRTPLSIISAQIEAIGDGLYPADAAHLAPVNEQLHILEQLIDDMRTVALADAGALPLDLVPLDIATPIDHALAAFQAEATSKGVTLTADYSHGLPRALADEQRVRQVLTNLITNALRHTASGGHVTVAARPATVTAGVRPPASAAGGDAGEQIEVSVRDDGTGIPAELLPDVFDRFAKDPGSTGSGLGLAICRDLVEAQAGQISIESAPGRGTTVTFTLPQA